ncbi:MAG: hypothetical protein ABJC74_06885 [Gemmatimonadota bacterium]
MAGPPALQSFKDFQKATSGGAFRGREELESMDYALSQLQEYGTSMSTIDRLAMLQLAIRACKNWLADKASKLKTKPTTLVQKRATAVTALLNQLSDSYRFESYKGNKAGGRVDQKKGMELKGLAGNYAFEATSQAKGVAHPSASDVLHYAEQKGMGANSKEGYTAAKDAYMSDGNRGGATEQFYYNRSARMRYLLLVQRGKFYTDPTTLADVNGPYAMDEYGNLFAQEVPTDARAFNHSSFCRGKQVVCAGILMVDQGELLDINNMSGHYKPGPNQLANLIRLLIGNGLNLSRTEVMCTMGPGGDANRPSCATHAKVTDCKAADGASGPFMKLVLSKAADFLNNPSGLGLPVVDPKTFKSAAEQQSAFSKARIEYRHIA